MAKQLDIEVVYHRPGFVFNKAFEVNVRTTVDEALTLSGLFTECPELEGNIPAVGIYGQVVDRSQPVSAGDRIEVYRSLVFDPKEARRQRAQEAAKKRPPKRGRRRSANQAPDP